MTGFNESKFAFPPVPILSATIEEDDYQLAKELLAKIETLTHVGDDVLKLESEFSKWLGVNTSIAWTGGRTALYAAIKALNLQPGDEVIVPAFTCQAVINAFKFQQVVPVYADIEEQSYGLSITEVRKKLSARTKGILLQYTFGLIPKDIKETIAWARENDLWIIEDCAHALGAEWEGQKLGALGDISIFSSERSKIINTVHGGISSTDNPTISESLLALKRQSPTISTEKTKNLLETFLLLYEQNNNLPLSIKKEHAIPQMFTEELEGKFIAHYKELMSPAIATLFLKQFSKLEKFQSQRDKATRFWNQWCDNNGYEKPLVVNNSRPTFLRYPIYAGKHVKDNLLELERKLNVNLGVWFTTPAHPMPIKVPDCPVGMRLTAGCINMPTILPQAFYDLFNFKDA